LSRQTSEKFNCLLIRAHTVNVETDNKYRIVDYVDDYWHGPFYPDNYDVDYTPYTPPKNAKLG